MSTPDDTPGPRMPGPRTAAAEDLDATGPEPSDDTDTAQDYVTFEMDGEMYAVRMHSVHEIIRVPEIVRVPLGPSALEGLANLRGRVLPVVSLRACCGMPPADHDEATRVVVVSAAGATIGFVVDRVAAVASVDAESVEDAADVQSTIRSSLVAAVVKGEGSMTTVIDVERLVADEFSGLGHATGTASGTDATGALAGQDTDDDSEDTLELVSFAVDGQEYALPIDRVQEIVQVPERITPVPNAEARVVGVMDLRGRLLPVISLRQMFGLPVTALEPHNRIVVVTVGNDDDGSATGRRADPSLVGVVLDTVREVLRVPGDVVGDLPVVVAGRGRTEVTSVCRLDEGSRLVSVLAADALVGERELAELTRLAELAGVTGLTGVTGFGDDTTTGDADHDSEDTVGDNGDDRDSDDRDSDDELLVVFRLDDEEYCVSVDTVQEIIRVPENLVRVPGTPEYVEGLVNLRGAVLPVVDLRTRLGLPRSDRDERQRIVVLTLGGVRTGFVVDSVAEVLPVPASGLETAPELSEEQARVVTRVANLPLDRRMLLILDAQELIRTDASAEQAGEPSGQPSGQLDPTASPYAHVGAAADAAV